MTPKARFWVVAAVAVLAAAGVVGVAVVGGDDGGRSSEGSPGSADEASAVDVIPSAAGPPGTALGDGFTVPEGTTLIGDPIPIGVAVVQSGQPIVDQGWTATSVIEDGDPVEIIEAYVRQAEAAGLVRQSGPGCARDRELALCSAFARSADRSAPRSLSVTVARGRREDVVSDHVVVRFSTADLSWEHGDGQNGEDDLSEMPAPPDQPALAGVGERLGTAGETTHAVVVQEGSRLAGPPRVHIGDATGGMVAILEVTGEPRAVLRAYLDHLAELGPETSEPEVVEIGDAVVTAAGGSEAGGDHFDLTLVERPGRPPWLEISGSHD